MANSRKSNSAYIFDLPKPRNMRARFLYNYFTKDESIDDVDEVTKTDQFFTDPDPASRPRMVHLEFDDPINSNIARQTEIFGKLPQVMSHAFRALFLERLDTFPDILNRAANDLELIPTSRFTDITFQDANISSKLFTLVQKTFNRRIIQTNEEIEDAIDQEQTDFNNRRARSQNDFAKILRRNLSNVSDDFLVNALNQTSELSEAFIDENEREEITSNIFDDIKGLGLNARVNSKVVGSVVTSVSNEGISIYSEEMTALKQAALDEEEESAQNFQFGNDAMYFTLLDSFGGQEITLPGIENITLDLLGYAVDKFQDLGDGNVVKKKTILVNIIRDGFFNPVKFDFDVAYGTGYTYSARAIYIMSVPTENGDQNSNAVFLVSSKPSESAFVSTHEIIPPEPPADFVVNYDFQKRVPLLTWTFPRNKANDIKRFQVLRRRSINDPFELITEIDFDDSIIKYDTPEFISEHNKRVYKNPITFHFDEQFKQDESYIYTLRSVDAHGNASGYCEQISARFDRFTNNLVTDMVSIRGTRRGCPVQYPNYYIDNSVLQQTAKDSFHSRVKLYLDPEYLKVLASDPDDPQRTQDLHFLPFSGDGENAPASKFKLQILNTDLQQTKIVDIVIKDGRTQQDN